jgi:cathepsin B
VYDEKTPLCIKTCQPNYSISYQKDKHFGKSAYSLDSVKSIQTEIMNNGPVEGTLDVYEDLLTYKKGELHLVPKSILLPRNTLHIPSIP